ncbi:MAG: DUF4332 domain-containing protein [Thermosynechococcaceae cyanobacterium]
MTVPSLNRAWPLAQLPGLSSTDCQKLEALGVETTWDLLQRTRRPGKQIDLAAQLHLSERWVRKWVALAELSHVPSVGCQYCGLLLHAGVTSVEQLAAMTTHTLHRQILRLQVTATQNRALCPHPGMVAQWIQEAQQYRRSQPQ